MNNYSIALAVIKNKDKYLIGKRAKDKEFEPNEWEFISGFIEENELPSETILREIKEETGLSGKIIKSEKSFEFTDEEGIWTISPFLVQSDSNYKLNIKEHSELKWVNKEELSEYEDIEEIIDYLRDLIK